MGVKGNISLHSPAYLIHNERHTMSENNDSPQIEPANYSFEVALVRTARALFDYVELENNPEAIKKIFPILASLEKASNDYVNLTNSLHPDLGLELREWATLKSEFLSPEHSINKSPQSKNIDRDFIDHYGDSADRIIKYLENSLGLEPKTTADTNDDLHNIPKPPSLWEPSEAEPPYTGVIAGTDHVVSFKTGGLNYNHTLIADGDLSNDNDTFNGKGGDAGHDHFGSKY